MFTDVHAVAAGAKPTAAAVAKVEEAGSEREAAEIAALQQDNCWDNVPTENLWGSMKVGRLHGRRFGTGRDATDEIVDRLTFYNHRRLHSSLGYVKPMQFERARLAAQQRQVA